ncbi:MAG: HTH-type transcriptional regulator, sugar sensing transcriptional regulator [Gemmatimonadales bacterium]|nr:HTH-type transcriptional regulator, sugar sensing transcriptional regulator [Gemmatimonadales bacterium]
MPRIDLTRFGFTPTESLIYEVLLTSGPGTGYALARAAGLARANAYSALEGLVSKGAARVEGGRPRQYRPEPPTSLIARISNEQGLALERLSADLDSIAVPATPTVVEIETGRAVLQLITHDVARATRSVALAAPPDAFPLLAPALRRPVSSGLPVELYSTSPVDLGFHPVQIIAEDHSWPGMPIISVVDDRSAILGSRQGSEVRGHWSTAPALVAAARLTLQRLRASP